MNIQEIMDLSVSEKILLVEKIWDSIAQDASKEPLPEWKRKLLQERMNEHNNDPKSGTSWDELKLKYNA